MMNFNEKIKKIRINNKLTQEEFADILKVSRSAVAKWEQGRGMPSLDLLERISKVYELSIDELISEEEIKKETFINMGKINKIDKERKIVFFILAILAVFAICISIVLIKKFDVFAKNYSDYRYGLINEIADDYIQVNMKDRDEEVKIKLKEDIVIFDKYGKSQSKNCLKENYTIRIKYDFYKNKGFYKNTVNKNISRIDVINDFSIDEYNVYGFFFVTSKEESVILSEIPLYIPSFNLNAIEKQYTINNIKYGQSFIYPYYVSSINEVGNYQYSNFIDIQHKETVYSNILKDQMVATYTQYSIDVSSEYNVFVFSLDNSISGFSLAGKLSKENNKIISLLSKNYAMHEVYLKKKKYELISVIDDFYNIKVNFKDAAEYLGVKEYDSSYELIKEKVYTCWEEFPKSMYMSKDETRIIEIEQKIVINGGYQISSNEYIRGDYIETLLPSKYGYLIGKDIRII